MKKLIVFCSLILLFSCSPQLYIPIEATSNIPLEELKKGRDLYVNSCASCHQLYLPSKFSKKEWEENLDRMQPKAKITDAEKQLIYQYITSEPKK